MKFDKFKVVESFLTKKECDDILKKCLSELSLTTASVYDEKTSEKIVNNKRKSKVAFIELKELFKKLNFNLSIKFKIYDIRYFVSENI